MKRDENQLQKIKCPACEGTGFQRVKQPAQPAAESIPRRARNVWSEGRLAIEAK